MKNLTEFAMQGLPNIRRDLGIETDTQRDMRLLQQGNVMGQSLSQGLPPAIANLSAGILQNIPGITDNIRQLGVQSGMSGLQTESELFDRALSGYDGTPESQAKVVQSLTAINPEWGAMMASRMQQANQESEIASLTKQKLEKELKAPEKWTPMVGFFPDGKTENIWVSPSGGVQDVMGNLLEGEARPKNFYPVSVAAAKFQDVGNDPLTAEWKQRQLIDNTFIGGAIAAYDLIDSQPAANTFSAQAASVYNGLKENVAWFSQVESAYKNEFKAGEEGFDRNVIDSKLDSLGIKGAEFKALMINLAYQKAKSMQGEADRISDTDLSNALDAIGGGISDSKSIKAILINNIMQTAQNYENGYEIMFRNRSDYQPFDAKKEFGVNDFFNRINYTPTGNEKVFSSTEINNMFGEDGS